ncbi:MAG: hypothetical protein YK1309IOTA_1910013 [Marine Group I thaumarchaeote]|nr:MAG: hypothetical protein YK1309IOTA_1910013 [Marine Group I thaumarchaeote]
MCTVEAFSTGLKAKNPAIKTVAIKIIDISRFFITLLHKF